MGTQRPGQAGVSASVRGKGRAWTHRGGGTLLLRPAMGSIPAAGSTGTAFLGCVCLVELGRGQELRKSQFVSSMV